MALLTNSLEGGSNGTTITTANSGGTSGNAFTAVSIGASATLTFDNAHAAHGGLAMKATTPAVATSSFAYWGTSLGAGQGTVWFRAYLYLTANPGVNTRAVTFWTTTSAGTICASVVLKTTGKVAFWNSGSSEIIVTTASVPLNQWFRIEGFCVSSATVGQLELKLFSSMDAVTPDETQTSTALQNTGASIGSTGFGPSSSVASVTYWMDDVAVSTTGYPGPAATTWAAAGTAAGASGASGALAPAVIAGTAAGSSSAAGALQPVAIGGTAPAASIATGTLAPAVIAGSAASTSQATGAFLPAPLAGTAAPASSAAGSFTPAPLAGTSAGSSTAPGTITLGPATVSATAEATSTASGAFQPAPIAGTAASVPQAAGTLGALDLAGTSITLTAASADIPPGGFLSGTAITASLAAGLLARTYLVLRCGKLCTEITAASVLPGAEAGKVIGPMGLARIVSTDPVRNILIAMRTLEQPDGSPVNPVTAALPVSVAFVPVGLSPDTAAWLAADWITAVDGSFRVRCQVGSGATGALAIGRYQPYVRVQNGGETITVPAADVLEAY